VHLALARVGVGIGEAGCSPAAHSLIADYYPPQQRSTAMGIYSLGISLGIMIAYLAGGWVAQNIGWRAAFFIVGLPGLILAAVVRYTLQEPPRGMSEGRIDPGQRPDVLTVTRYLLRRKSFIHLAIGSGLASFVAYAVITFFPSYMIRSHGMGLAEIGVYLGLIIGIASGLGYVGGGYLADKASIVGQKYSLWTVSAAMILGWLFNFPVYLLNNPYWVFAAFAVPTIFTNFYLATTFAQVQGLVGLRMRAVASALLLFLLNIIGLGLGPMFTGILSDLLRESFGNDSLRYSLLLVSGVIFPWSAWHFYVAGRHIEADLARVDL
jgi:predicted MFS family arabinose efflux permease